MQRQKNFFAYQDLESSFERRPSLWAEPIGDWGEGSVKLIEIPTKEEIHDNIAGFWQPKGRCRPRASTPTPTVALGPGHPKPSSLAGFPEPAIGAKRRQRQDIRPRSDRRPAQVDRSQKILRGVVTAEKAEIQNIVTQPNPATGGWRLSFELSLKEKSARRIAGLADAGQRRHIGSLGLSMDTLRRDVRPELPQHSNCRSEVQFLPRESPMEMSSSNCGSFQQRRAGTRNFESHDAWLRRAFIFAGTIVLTAAGCYEMYEVLQVGGVTILEWMVLVLFVMLFAWIAFSFYVGVGRLCGAAVSSKDPLGIDPSAASAGDRQAGTRCCCRPTTKIPTASWPACARSTNRSRKPDTAASSTGSCLSDTTDPAIWIAEEKCFLQLRHEVGPAARIYLSPPPGKHRPQIRQYRRLDQAVRLRL